MDRFLLRVGCVRCKVKTFNRKVRKELPQRMQSRGTKLHELILVQLRALVVIL